MNRWIICLSLVLLSWQCVALYTRGPEGPKGGQQTPSVATYKWINSSCVEFDGVILCSSQHVTHQVFNDVAYFMTGAAYVILMLILLGGLVWCFWKEPEFFYMWLKYMFISVFVLNAAVVAFKWGPVHYWCVFAAVWYSLDALLARCKQAWHDTIVPAWKDPASIANLKVE